VAEFLSPAWIAELDRALGALELSSGSAPFVIEQRITLPDGSTHVHHVIAGDGRFRAAPGPAAASDLVLTTDLETAIAIQRGAVNAQFALAAGHLRLGGDLDRLRAHADLFGTLDDVFAEVRASTSYPGAASTDSGADPGGKGRENPPLASLA
jgi:putative sterol carrier protein